MDGWMDCITFERGVKEGSMVLGVVVYLQCMEIVFSHWPGY
jgi:hypothetical protein